MKLQDLVSIKKGKKPPFIVDSPTVMSTQLILTPALRGEPIREFCNPYPGQVFAKPEDVLITWDGSVGKSACGLEGTVGSTLAVMKLKSDTHLTRYLWHFVRTKEALLVKTSKGASIPHIDPKVLASLEVPAPSIDSQKRAIGLLDNAEHLIEAREKQLALLPELEAALYLKAISSSIDSTTMEAATSGAGQMRTGPFGSQLLHSEFKEEGIAVLGIDNVVGNYFRWVQRRYISETKYQDLKRYTVLPGDVLITIMGTIGECVVVPSGIGPAINTKHLCSIRPDQTKFLPQYLRAALLYDPEIQRHIRRHAKGAIMSGLNLAIIKKAPIPNLPLAAQRKFEEAMTSVLHIRERLINAKTVESELFAALRASVFKKDSDV
jgi:type I restriction enzyme S subunit